MKALAFSETARPQVGAVTRIFSDIHLVSGELLGWREKKPIIGIGSIRGQKLEPAQWRNPRRDRAVGSRGGHIASGRLGRGQSWGCGDSVFGGERRGRRLRVSARTLLVKCLLLVTRIHQNLQWLVSSMTRHVAIDSSGGPRRFPLGRRATVWRLPRCIDTRSLALGAWTALGLDLLT